MTINRAFDFDHASTRIQKSRVYYQINSNSNSNSNSIISFSSQRLSHVTHWRMNHYQCFCAPCNFGATSKLQNCLPKCFSQSDLPCSFFFLSPQDFDQDFVLDEPLENNGYLCVFDRPHCVRQCHSRCLFTTYVSRPRNRSLDEPLDIHNYFHVCQFSSAPLPFLQAIGLFQRDNATTLGRYISPRGPLSPHHSSYI